MQSEAIFFIGPQGSGKGTQARILAEKLGFFYWEMGGILRQVATEESELGRTVKRLIESGVLLEDDILLRVAAARLDTIPKDKGIIFDGIPRRLGQAQFLFDYLIKQGRNEFVTMFIDLPREESLSRLLARAQKEHRADDTEAAINFRLDQYEQETLPVLDFLRQRTTFITVDGAPPVDAVTASINAALGLAHE